MQGNKLELGVLQLLPSAGLSRFATGPLPGAQQPPPSSGSVWLLSDGSQLFRPRCSPKLSEEANPIAARETF